MHEQLVVFHARRALISIKTTYLMLNISRRELTLMSKRVNALWANSYNDSVFLMIFKPYGLKEPTIFYDTTINYKF